jgi:hypothetical protein
LSLGANAACQEAGPSAQGCTACLPSPPLCNTPSPPSIRLHPGLPLMGDWARLLHSPQLTPAAGPFGTARVARPGQLWLGGWARLSHQPQRGGMASTQLWPLLQTSTRGLALLPPLPCNALSRWSTSTESRLAASASTKPAICCRMVRITLGNMEHASVGRCSGRRWQAHAMCGVRGCCTEGVLGSGMGGVMQGPCAAA